jgi:hypothetical protein
VKTVHDHTELERQHLLTVIERAQRDGKSESEIVELVDPAFAADRAKVESLAARRRLGRLIGRGPTQEAA